MIVMVLDIPIYMLQNLSNADITVSISHGMVTGSLLPQFKAYWRNGGVSDYESGGRRFDPCIGHVSFFFVLPITMCLTCV
jgi:hypothetical protein